MFVNSFELKLIWVKTHLSSVITNVMTQITFAIFTFFTSISYLFWISFRNYQFSEQSLNLFIFAVMITNRLINSKKKIYSRFFLFIYTKNQNDELVWSCSVFVFVVFTMRCFFFVKRFSVNCHHILIDCKLQCNRIRGTHLSFFCILLSYPYSL